MPDAPEGLYSLGDLKVSPTASLFEGFRDEDVDLSFFFIPPETPHGFENVGDVPLVQLGIHERWRMQQTWLDT